MNMNKRSSIYILTAALTFTSLSACQKDFLERPPLDQISEVTFWKTEKDVYETVMGVYEKLPGDNMVYDDGSTDNAHVQNAWEGPASSTSAGTISSTEDAGWYYIDIRRANYFLENANKVKVIAPELLTRYEAEVRFLRAFSYFRLMSLFGDVPLITKTLAIGEENVPRTPKKEVLAFVLQELDAVAKILPAAYAGGKPNEKGRITKGAALALKMRAHLYEGDWRPAADAAAEVMTMGYDLFTTTAEEPFDAKDDYSKWVDFTDNADREKFRKGLRSYERLFREVNEGNKEVILNREQITQKDENSFNTYLPPATLGGWSSVTPTQAMVDSYGNYKTGEAVVPVDPAQRAAWYTSDKIAFANEYKNRDPRFYASILFDGAPWNAMSKTAFTFTWEQGNNMSKTGYNFRKLVDPIAYEGQIGNHANVILIRYAEVLLSYAEAKNELTGPDATVYDALDKIRTRAGMPVIDRSKYASQAALRAVIRSERRVELALEGQRYMDIRRWKIAPEVMKTIKNVANQQVQERVWTDKLYLMPVPQSQIDLSKGVLTQTPGYSK